MANTSGWLYHHGNWCRTPLKDVLLKSLRTLLSSPSLSIVGQQADINLSLVTLVCHSPPGTRAASLCLPVWRHFPACGRLFSLQIQFSDWKLSGIKDINYYDVCGFLPGQTADGVVDTDGHSSHQGGAVIPVVQQDGKAREHFEEASGPPTVGGCRYNNFIMWRRPAATWGLNFGEVLMAEAFKKPFSFYWLQWNLCEEL